MGQVDDDKVDRELLKILNKIFNITESLCEGLYLELLEM